MYREIKEVELRTQKSNGYLYFIDKNHPLKCGNSHKVYYHRHLASIYLGRWVLPEEVVHHIDSIKTNNSEDNLLVLTDSEHSILHHQILGHASSFERSCNTCGKAFTTKPSEDKYYCSVPCSDVAKIKRTYITKELLDSLIPTTSWVVLGKMFGYSDNGIKKRAKALGCKV